MGIAEFVAFVQDPAPMPDPMALGSLGLRPLLAMAFVVALLGATVWALRTTAAKRRSRQSLAVESAVSLGERRSLVIVTVEGRRLLLGVAPGNVSLVTELSPPFGQALADSLRSGEQA